MFWVLDVSKFIGLKTVILFLMLAVDGNHSLYIAQKYKNLLGFAIHNPKIIYLGALLVMLDCSLTLRNFRFWILFLICC